MLYARLNDVVVAEIIESNNIYVEFHPDFVATLVQVDSTVKVGMIKTGDTFSYQTQDTISDEERRAGMILSAADARLRLAEKGLLLRVMEVINQLPEDNTLKIKWEYSINLHRTDPVLVDFCKSTFGLTDEQIDEFFKL